MQHAAFVYGGEGGKERPEHEQRFFGGELAARIVYVVGKRRRKHVFRRDVRRAVRFEEVDERGHAVDARQLYERLRFADERAHPSGKFVFAAGGRTNDAADARGAVQRKKLF